MLVDNDCKVATYRHITGAVGEGLAVKFNVPGKWLVNCPTPTDILTGKVKNLDTKEVSAMYSLITPVVL